MFIGNERRTKVVALVLAIVLVAGVVLALLATVAQAAPAHAVAAALPTHTSLVSVTPRDGAQLDHGPAQVLLTFDEAVDARFVQVRLSRDGMPVATAAPAVDGTVVTVRVTGATGAGAYRLAWRVTGTDGHPVTGESSFTVAGPAGARPRVTPTYKTPQMQQTTFGHPDHRPGLVVAAVLVLGGVALLVYESRRRRPTHHPRQKGPVS